MSGAVAFLFDLDGTLVDSVYNHVRAWHVALRENGLDLLGLANSTARSE